MDDQIVTLNGIGCGTAGRGSFTGDHEGAGLPGIHFHKDLITLADCPGIEDFPAAAVADVGLRRGAVPKGSQGQTNVMDIVILGALFRGAQGYDAVLPDIQGDAEIAAGFSIPAATLFALPCGQRTCA